MPAPKKKDDGHQPAKNAIETLNTRLREIAEEMKVIQNVADSEQRALTKEEVDHSDELTSEFNRIEKELQVRGAQLDMEQRLAEPQARRSKPDDVEPNDGGEGGAPAAAEPPARPGRSIVGGNRPGATKGTFGFISMGEWALAAKRTHHGKPDARIMNAPTTFGSEGQNQDGGFAVPPDFRQQIMKQVLGEESLLSRCDQQFTSSNSLILPLDTTTPWATSGGVLVNWIGEGAAITQSKPKLGSLETKLGKAAALIPLTDELMTDVPALTSWLMSKVPDKFTSFFNDAIVNGTGIGQPMGLLNANAKVTQAAESGQGAGTVVYKNITNMWSRMYAKFRNDAVWLINQDVEPQLQSMAFPAAAGSAVFPAYMPAGGLSGSPYATLMGRPILPIEACQTVGTEGDIILTSLSQYLAVLKTEGMRSDVSIHLYFDTDHTAFRFIMRFGGQSYWPAAVARAHGSNTLSPIVTLNSTRT